MLSAVWLLSIAIFLIAFRFYTILSETRREVRRQPPSAPRKVAIFLGSGGHTTEALKLMSALDFRRYNPRIYIISEGDFLSERKALEFETPHDSVGGLQFTVLTIPRARRVHQSLLTTPFSVAWSLMLCIHHLTILPLLKFRSTAFADILILNGPGTCFVLCLAVYTNRLLGLPSPTLIYVETFARVKSLSLSGRLIRPFADRFVTQWPLCRENPLTAERWLV